MLAEKVYHSRLAVDRYVLENCLIRFREILPNKGKINNLLMQLCTKSIEIDQTAIINLIPTSFPLKHFFYSLFNVDFHIKVKIFLDAKQTNKQFIQRDKNQCSKIQNSLLTKSIFQYCPGKLQLGSESL